MELEQDLTADRKDQPQSGWVILGGEEAEGESNREQTMEGIDRVDSRKLFPATEMPKTGEYGLS